MNRDFCYFSIDPHPFKGYLNFDTESIKSLGGGVDVRDRAVLPLRQPTKNNKH